MSDRFDEHERDDFMAAVKAVGDQISRNVACGEPIEVSDIDKRRGGAPTTMVTPPEREAPTDGHRGGPEP